MKRNNDLYDECKDCETLDHCPHPDVEKNGFSTPMPPGGCFQTSNHNAQYP